MVLEMSPECPHLNYSYFGRRGELGVLGPRTPTRAQEEQRVGDLLASTLYPIQYPQKLELIHTQVDGEETLVYLSSMVLPIIPLVTSRVAPRHATRVRMSS